MFDILLGGESWLCKKIAFFIISVFLAFIPTFPLLQAFGFGEGLVICDRKYFPEKGFNYDFCQFYGQGLINLFLNLVLSILFIFAFSILTKIVGSIHRKSP